MTYVIGNVLDVLPTLEAGRFQCCVTSPPYWGLRDYGHPDQLGLEPTPREFVERMVGVFREVRRWFGVELQPDYAPLIDERTAQRGLFGKEAT